MSVEILNIDCLEYMAGLDNHAFDLAIVDPPYGLGMDKGVRRSKKLKTKTYQGDWDSKRPSEKYFSELIRVSKHQIIWGGNFFADLLPAGKHWIFWDKLQTVPSLGDGELAWTSIARQSITKHALKYCGILGSDLTRIHPTQKPIKLYEWLLSTYAKPEMKILDTHLGSGSSAIAAHYFGCDFVGCEIDSGFFNAAKQRYSDETKQKVLF